MLLKISFLAMLHPNGVEPPFTSAYVAIKIKNVPSEAIDFAQSTNVTHWLGFI